MYESLHKKTIKVEKQNIEYFLVSRNMRVIFYVIWFNSFQYFSKYFTILGYKSTKASKIL